MNTDLEELSSELTPILTKYRKNDLLEWLTATSVQQGNEIYLVRFAHLKYLALSIPEEDFGDEEVNQEAVKEIIDVIENYSWSHVEGYEPNSNDSDNVFGLRNEKYNFLSADGVGPELELEKVVRRFFEFSEEGVYDFSVEEELVKLLEIQTEMVELICRYEGEVYHGFDLPTDDFVEDFSKLVNRGSEFSEDLWQSNEEIPEIDNLRQTRQFFVKNPIINDSIYTPNLLLEAFFDTLSEGFIETEEDLSDLVRDQLKLEVLRAITEIVPREGIIDDFDLGVSDSIDLGFIADDKFYFLMLIEETVEDKKARAEEIVETFDAVEERFETEETLSIEGQDINISNIDPIFIIVPDALTRGFTAIENGDKATVNLIPYPCLEYIFERLKDEGKDAPYLSKIIEKRNELKDVQAFSFGDLFEVIRTALAKDFLANTDIMGMIQPHIWSEKQRKINRDYRPKLDIRPENVDRPFFFKIIKQEENLYYGYNNIAQAFFYRVDIGAEVFTKFRMKPGARISSSEDTEILDFISYLIARALREVGDCPPRANEIQIDVRPISWTRFSEFSTGFYRVLEAEEGYIFLVNREKFKAEFSSNPLETSQEIVDSLSSKIQSLEIQNLEDLDRSTLKGFDLEVIPTPSTSQQRTPSIPDEMDYLKIDLELVDRFKGEIEEGSYTGQEAKNVVRELYGHIHSSLLEEMEKFDEKKLTRLGYQELERSLRARKTAIAKVSTSQSSSEAFEEYLETEGQLNHYIPTARYIMEENILRDVNGDEKPSISDWQSLCTKGRKAIEFAAIQDYLTSLEGVLEVKIELDFTDGLEVIPKIEGNPIYRHLNNVGEIYRESDLSEIFPETEEIKDEEIEELDQEFQDISDELESSLDFTIEDYVKVTSSLAGLTDRGDEAGLITIQEDELKTYLTKKTQISRDKISTILDFITLKLDSKDQLETWKVESRNRITIRPLIRLDGDYFVGLETVMLSQEKFLKGILAGKWPLPGQAQENLRDALNSRDEELSTRFEKEVEGEVAEKADYTELNLCKQVGRNTGILSNVEEDCPGEMDVVSIHRDSKKLILWEAKDFAPRVGPREVGTAVEWFVEEGGYRDKLDKKEDYLRKNISTILDMRGIDDSEEWCVESVFVLSRSGLVKEVLDQELDVISNSEVDEFIS